MRRILFGAALLALSSLSLAHYFGIVPLTNQTPIVLTASPPVTSAPQVTQLSADYVCTNAANQVQGAPASARARARR